MESQSSSLIDPDVVLDPSPYFFQDFFNASIVVRIGCMILLMVFINFTFVDR